MPTLILDNDFKKDLLFLSKLEQKQSVKAFRFLAENPMHPSLQIHRIQGTYYWEAYVNKDIRIIYEQNSDTLTLLAIGLHDILKKF